MNLIIQSTDSERGKFSVAVSKNNSTLLVKLRKKAVEAFKAVFFFTRVDFDSLESVP